MIRARDGQLNAPSSLERADAIPSTIAIRGHPIHPVLVTFPIAALLGLVATDFTYYLTLDPFWARTSHWLAATGAITGTLAGAAGAIDLLNARGAAKLPSAQCTQ